MTKKPRLNLAARTFKVELGVFLRTCESVGTVRALTCYLLAESGEWTQYLDLDRPDFDSPTFADDYLVSEIMRKNPNLTTTYQPRVAAVASWWQSEIQCRDTNDRLGAFSQGDVSPLDGNVIGVIDRARSILSNVLGPLTSEKLRYMESNFRYGPGATSSVSGNDVIHSKKYTCSMHVTPRLYPYWRTLAPRSSTEISLRAFSKVTFVPKTSKTDRAIAIEPHLNIYVQLGIGALLRQRLRRYGVDLDNQSHKNRDLARIAHSAGLATIDLSSASDTIASELVWLLLPFEWASLLDVARTEYSQIDGEEVRLSKFSSMGNGYTFELESLIFLALARACNDPTAVAFGDDIITKRESVPLLLNALRFLGFSVNSNKTFMAGRFFESCGYDYHDGVMIRPFYLKGTYHDFTTACIRIANKVRRYSHMRTGNYGCDLRFIRVWSYARRACPLASSTYLPHGYGDAGIVVNFDEARPAKLRHGHEGYTCIVVRERMRTVLSHESSGALMHALHRGAFEQPKSVEQTRMFKTTARGKQSVPDWPNLGPWLSRDELLSYQRLTAVGPFRA